MGLLDSLKKKLEGQRKQENEKSLGAQLPEIQRDAKNAFDVWNKTFDGRKAFEALTGHDVSSVNVSLLSKRDLLASQYLFALYFGVDFSRLDSDFAQYVLRNLNGNILFSPGWVECTCPYDFHRFVADQWAKKYLERNPEEILKGETFIHAHQAYIEMDACRSKWKNEPIMPIDAKILTKQDMNGATEMAKLIFAKGLFDLTDYRESLQLIRTYARQFNEDIYKLHEFGEHINAEQLNEILHLPVPKTFKSFKLIIERIFVDEKNNLRNPGMIRYYTLQIFNEDFPE